MKLKMHENSLFAILLRSPWWISVLVGLALTLSVRYFWEETFGFFAGLPFFVIGAYALWTQLRAPSESRVTGTLAAIREMSWADFCGAVEAAYQRQGYTVSRVPGGQADLALVKSGRTTLVACKRWKAARTGIEPLRDLYAAKRAREAYDCMYIAAGELTDQARAFAVEHNVRLLQGAELAALLPEAGKR
jgi:restriction system protein